MNKQESALEFINGRFKDMQDKIIEQSARIAELEAMNNKLSRKDFKEASDLLEGHVVITKSDLTKRDIKMKEKGVYEFTASTGFWDLSTCKLRTYSRDFQKHLRKQAGEL